MSRIEKSMFLTYEEMKADYPALLTLVGDNLSIRRVTSNPGLSSAHMVFAPDIEHRLRDALKTKLWDAFRVEVSVKRRSRRKVSQHVVQPEDK